MGQPAVVSVVSTGRLDNRLCRQVDPDYPQLCQRIKQRYHEVHGAELVHFHPTQLVLSRDGEPLGSAGFIEASTGDLYLEQYLDAPVEAVLAERLGRRIERDRILEVGNLEPVDVRALVAVRTTALGALRAGERS